MTTTPAPAPTPAAALRSGPGRRPLAGLLLAAVAAFAAPVARGGAPAPAGDELLRLVPAEAGVVFALDDLRGRWGEVEASDLAREVRALPAFQAWLGSPSAGDFFRARDRILDFLQVSPRQVRDDILGDAVVLAIFLPEDRSLDHTHARGLLTLKARDPALLRRLIDRINEAQRESGELAEVVEAERGGTVYATRRFPGASTQLPESYALFPDGVFAFSNSETLIHEVIDRKADAARGGPSFADAPGFREAAGGLAGRPLARAFVAPEFLSRAFESLPREDDPDARRVVAALRDYLAAMSRAGASLTVEDARVQLRVAQAFKPGPFRRLGETVFAPFRTGTDGIGPGPRLMDLPPSAVAAASFRVDVPVLYRFLAGLAPEKDQPKIAKLESLATALLLGQDLRERILPALGPRTVAYVESDAIKEGGGGPGAGASRFPAVVAIEINDEMGGGGSRPSAAAALDNALRGALAALSLDEGRAPPTARVVTREGVTSLDIPFPFAFAIDSQARRLIVGNSSAAVARYLEAGADARAGGRFRSIQAAAFPDCEAFACLDLAALAEIAERHKGRLVAATARRQGRTAAEVAPEVDQVLGLARLFDSAYLAGRVDAPRSVVEHRLGLIPRPAAPPTVAR